MNGVARGSSRRKRLLAIVLFSMIFLSGCLGSGQENAQQTDADGEIVLEVWHTFAAESKEEEVFMNSVSSFESANPNVTVDVTMVPFGNADQLFMTAAQG